MVKASLFNKTITTGWWYYHVVPLNTNMLMWLTVVHQQPCSLAAQPALYRIIKKRKRKSDSGFECAIVYQVWFFVPFVRVLFMFLKLVFVCREQYGFWNQKRFQKICRTKDRRSKRERKISWRFLLLKSTQKSRAENLFWLNRMVPKLLLSLRDA